MILLTRWKYILVCSVEVAKNANFVMWVFVPSWLKPSSVEINGEKCLYMLFMKYQANCNLYFHHRKREMMVFMSNSRLYFCFIKSSFVTRNIHLSTRQLWHPSIYKTVIKRDQPGLAFVLWCFASSYISTSSPYLYWPKGSTTCLMLHLR